MDRRRYKSRHVILMFNGTPCIFTLSSYLFLTSEICIGWRSTVDFKIQKRSDFRKNEFQTCQFLNCTCLIIFKPHQGFSQITPVKEHISITTKHYEEMFHSSTLITNGF